MGTDVDLIVGGGGAGDLVERAARRIRELERRWSRFDPHSEISALNRSGRPTAVSEETFELIERAVTGWRLTGGAFDPTVLEAVAALGYDRDFASLGGVSGSRSTGPSRGCGGTVLSRETRVVSLPDGVGKDPGGIGKGLAADMVARDLMRAGARGCCVNIGGDLRVEGRAPGGGPWTVEVEDPLAGGGRVACLRIRRGAATTSCRTRRTWATRNGARHHLVDPSTGDSADSGVAAVTVVSGLAWKGEVLSKAAFVAGARDGLALVERHGAAGLIVDDDGCVQSTANMEELLA